MKNSKAMFWTGWVLSAFPILMMGVAPVIVALTSRGMVADGLKKVGFPPEDAMLILGLEMACGIIYAIPQTSVLGAILATGYLGGATAAHVRVGQSPAAPVIFGVIVWLGLFLREPRLRALVPWRR